MSKSDRQKASDVFANLSSVFSKKSTFEEAFPDIDSVNVHVMESTYEGNKTAFWGGGEYADCSNPLCYGGGISVGELLRSMVRERQTEGALRKMCRGYEGSPKGQRRYRSCVHVFEVVARVTYKEVGVGEAEPSEDGVAAADGEM